MADEDGKKEEGRGRAFAAKAGIIQSVSAEGCASCRLYRVRVPGTFVNSAEHRNDGMQRREEYNIIDSL
ncbi:predicted protein [Plenodomus lingam JN3]|uniref:Predicted protein n=1 Tax=Leptosphaeria maculans (strain JN3 / isolate v23.1.3 / race Av1-4-5-6-7-8) TaxID=985895 RepID=E4ZZN7_LEPMJ|nr:predicted protein [Plenodomus lingam JN3]CBX97153.1 predicted protein [Plenodomus lingam JN3]